MDKQPPYSNIIERKLEQLPSADVEQLWSNMQAILDKKMPQKNDRRRFLGWLLANKVLLLAGTASIATFCLAFIYLPGAKTAINNKLSATNTITTTKVQSPTQASIHSEREKAHTIITTSAAQTNNEEKVKAITPAHIFTTSKRKKESTYSSSPATAAEDNTIVKDANNRLANNQRGENRYKKAAPSIPGVETTNNNEVDPTSTTASAVSLRTTSVHQASTDVQTALQPLALTATTNTSLQQLLRLQQSTNATVSNPGLKKNNSTKGPYIGLVAGLDLSSVQFNSMQSGANKGLIVGYDFNKRWSIESGLFWDKKRYVGDGSDYNSSGYTPPAGVKMLSVNGECQMYEWPVNVKFTILPQKHGLFVSAGLSSYYMKRESYEYNYEQNGQYQEYNHTYTNETKNWFSVANFSLGYTYKIGSGISLRMEPYLKLPIKNLGVNNMRIVSTGVNVGFTKQILR